MQIDMKVYGGATEGAQRSIEGMERCEGAESGGTERCRGAQSRVQRGMEGSGGKSERCRVV